MALQDPSPATHTHTHNTLEILQKVTLKFLCLKIAFHVHTLEKVLPKTNSFFPDSESLSVVVY